MAEPAHQDERDTMTMHEQDPSPHPARRDRRLKGRGQTLAEFALSLPILLILMFGIIEFGRIFQAWVTIQNAARNAARYASTGQFDEARYDIEAIVPCDNNNDWRGVAYSVPRTRQDTNSPAEVTAYRYPGAGDDDTYEAPTPAESEHLFATWYTGRDCQATDTDLQLRRDLLRLVSIYEEARRGAAGLAIEPSQVEPNPQSVYDFLTSYWQSPPEGFDRSGWFHVMICSSRAPIHPETVAAVAPLTPGSDTGQRFHTAVNFSEYPPAACVLQEGPTAADTNLVDNKFVPWADAGSSGDRVSIIVTFNHPLITPLGLASYIQLQAQRSAVNEAFRVTNAERALGPNTDAGNNVPRVTETPIPPTETLAPTNTPVPTDTPEPTATDPPASPTQEPFDCDKIAVEDITYFGSRVFANVTNDNVEPAVLSYTRFLWYEGPFVAFEEMELSGMGLNNDIYWRRGGMADDVIDPDSPEVRVIDTRNSQWIQSGQPVPGGGNIETFHGVFNLSANRTIPARSQVDWQAEFSGIQSLENVPGLGPWDFGSFDTLDNDIEGTTTTEFQFTNADGTIVCDSIVPNIPPRPVPTEVPVGVTLTPTYTPDCADERINTSWVDFAPNADVTLRIDNNHNRASTLYGFRVVWPSETPQSDAYTPGVPNLELVRIVVGGLSANDPDGVEVFRASGGGDAVSFTQNFFGDNADDEGTWLTNYTIAPNESVLVHIDFTGIGSARLDERQHPGEGRPVHPYDFNGTGFQIECANNTPGDAGGPGGIPLGFNEIATVTEPPIEGRPATRTPGPTFTPSLTPTLVPTNTPGPTSTPAPTETPGPTDTAVPTEDIAPEEDDGGADSCGQENPNC